MIAHLSGTVSHRGTDTVVVDVHGVGYLVHVPNPMAIPPVGADVHLHTSHQVREDALDLYGFPDRIGLETFELLLRATGVGPKLGLAALRTHDPDTLRLALSRADLAVLVEVPGIGKKVAERLVLELRDKVAAPAGGDVAAVPAAPVDATTRDEAHQALAQLGFRDAEIRQSLADAPADATVEHLVRHALQQGMR